MLVYVICYGAAMLFAFSAHFTLSGMSLMFAALYLYLWEYGEAAIRFISADCFPCFMWEEKESPA